jgi:hypothetical protein
MIKVRKRRAGENCLIANLEIDRAAELQNICRQCVEMEMKVHSTEISFLINLEIQKWAQGLGALHLHRTWLLFLQICRGYAANTLL